MQVFLLTNTIEHQNFISRLYFSASFKSLLIIWDMLCDTVKRSLERFGSVKHEWWEGPAKLNVIKCFIITTPLTPLLRIFNLLRMNTSRHCTIYVHQRCEEQSVRALHGHHHWCWPWQEHT